MLIPNLRSVYVKSFKSWTEDHGPRLAAAFAFYAMLSLAPLLVLAVAIGGRVLGEASVKTALLKEANSNVGAQAAEFLETLIHQSSMPGASLAATVASLAIAVFGATNLFDQLTESVNLIWKVRRPRRGFRNFLLGKLAALALFLAFAFLFMAWAALDSWLGWVDRRAAGFQGWQYVSFAVSIAFLSLVFAAAFRALPKGMVAWGDVWYAAVTTAIGFAAAKFLLSLYFAFSGVSTAYGSAGALVVILLWIYYSAQVFFFGIEMTCNFAHMYGSQCERKPGQEPIPQDAPHPAP